MIDITKYLLKDTSMILINSKDLFKDSNNLYYPTQNTPLSNIGVGYEISEVFVYKTFYTISAERQNNKLVINAETITIPDGNYTVNSFISYVKTYAQTNIDATFNIVNLPESYKLKFTANTN